MRVSLEQLRAGNVYERRTGRGVLRVWCEPHGLVMDWEPFDSFARSYPPQRRQWGAFTLGRLMQYAGRLSGNPPTAKHRLVELSGASPVKFGATD